MRADRVEYTPYARAVMQSSTGCLTPNYGEKILGDRDWVRGAASVRLAVCRGHLPISSTCPRIVGRCPGRGNKRLVRFPSPKRPV